GGGGGSLARSLRRIGNRFANRRVGGSILGGVFGLPPPPLRPRRQRSALRPALRCGASENPLMPGFIRGLGCVAFIPRHDGELRESDPTRTPIDRPGRLRVPRETPGRSPDDLSILGSHAPARPP